MLTHPFRNHVVQFAVLAAVIVITSACQKADSMVGIGMDPHAVSIVAPGGDTSEISASTTSTSSTTATSASTVADTSETAGAAATGESGATTSNTTTATTASTGSTADTGQSSAGTASTANTSASTNSSANTTASSSSTVDTSEISGGTTAAAGSGCASDVGVRNSPTILVLDPHRSNAMQVQGRGALGIRGTIRVNSSHHENAFNVDGNDLHVRASTLQVLGGYHVSHGAELLIPDITTGIAGLADPLAGLAEPNCVAAPLRSDRRLDVHGKVTLRPGRYEGGIRIRRGSDVTMESGIYCLNGGGFKVHNAKVFGEGVMLYNGQGYNHNGHGCGGGDKKARKIEISGRDAHVHLSAMSSCGIYRGILIFQARDSKKRIKLSAKDMDLAGMIYAPSARVAVRAESCLAQPSAQLTHPFSKLIANSLKVHMHVALMLVDPSDNDVSACWDNDGDNDDENLDDDEPCA